jgi:hypothetical protein
MTQALQTTAAPSVVPFVPTEVGLSADYAQELLCPCCGFEYLHAVRVVVFDRGEDDSQGRRTTVDADAHGCGLVSQSTSLQGNPSMRRGAIAIEFSCEGCGGWEDRPIRLGLSQHKGRTLVEWV